MQFILSLESPSTYPTVVSSKSHGSPRPRIPSGVSSVGFPTAQGRPFPKNLWSNPSATSTKFGTNCPNPSDRTSIRWNICRKLNAESFLPKDGGVGEKENVIHPATEYFCMWSMCTFFVAGSRAGRPRADYQRPHHRPHVQREPDCQFWYAILQPRDQHDFYQLGSSTLVAALCSAVLHSRRLVT